MTNSHFERPQQKVKDLFAMHRGERRAFVVVLLACLLAAAWVTYEQWWRPAHAEPMADVQLAWLKWEDEQKDSGHSTFGARRPASLFAFDPNTVSKEQWVSLGLSPRQAEVMLRYAANGGRFRSKRDVARMRVVDPALFAQWGPFIQLPDSLSPRDQHYADADTARPRFSERAAQAKAVPPAHARVDVNSADTLSLVQVRGIGPAFARGIVKYRDRLGGFCSLEQLNEVYVLRDKPDAVLRLKNELAVDTQLVHHFALNSFTAEEMGPHPYAGWKVAKALVAYRKQHGPFHRVEDVKGCALVTDSVYRRLAPYLTVEP